MPHRISQRQLEQLPGCPLLLPFVYRLHAGEGTDADLDALAKFCIKHGRHSLARELLQPPDQLEQEK